MTNNAPGQCAQTLAFAPITTGNPTPTVTCRIGAVVISSPTAFPVGTTTVSCTASNAAGTASCSFTVAVQDAEPPVITCPVALTVQCDADVPAFNPAQVKVTDNCDPAPAVTHVSDVSTGTCPKIITRTYKATDAAGNSTTCTQTITVHDTIAPVISGCSNVTAAAQSGQLGTTLNYPLSATDNCDGPVPVTCTPAAGYFAIGQTPVTCTAVDHCGNLSSCGFTVTVTATTDPLRICTLGQGFYGNANGRFNGDTSFTLVTHLLEQGPLLVGKIGSRSLSILPGETALLEERMPAGGPPAALPANGDQTLPTAVLPLNNKGRFANVFLGQTITLALNARLSSALLKFPLAASFCTQGTLAGADGLKGTADDVLVAGDIQMFNVPASVITALSSAALGINDSTVKGLLELANRALAGLPIGGATVSDVNDAVDAVNRGFDECRLPANCATSPILADSFNDTFAGRPTLGAQGAAALALQGLDAVKPSSPPVAPLNIRVRSSNLAATKQPGEPDIAGNPGGKSVWWQWPAPRTGPVRVETDGSTFDTLLGVFTGTALSNLVLVAANDDANTNVLTSEVNFAAQAGVTYQIVVDGVNGASGEIVLTLVADPPQLCLPVTVTGDQVQFCISGDLGRIYSVEASPDLSNWTLLATALNSDGTLHFADPAKNNFMTRFYRVTFEP
jgi:PKD repeat protein